MPLHTFGVPKKHADPLEGGATLADSHALASMRAWWSSPVPLVVLAGPVGTGKSLAAAWALSQRWEACCAAPPRHPLRLGGTPIWLPAPLLARTATWNEDRINTWRDSMLLVLDDMGVEEAGDRTASVLDDLINHRSEGGAPTIITTNLDRKPFVERYGERIVDRLRACGLDDRGRARWWITCSGESMRGRIEPQPPIPPGAEEPSAIAERYVSFDRMRVEVEKLRVEFERRNNEIEQRRREQVEQERKALLRIVADQGGSNGEGA